MRLSLSAMNPFSFLFVSTKRENYLAAYVLRECRHGRSLDDVLADRYILNRSTPSERERLLERPEFVSALGEQAVAEMKRTLDRGGSKTAVKS
jgi:hypothetical protein